MTTISDIDLNNVPKHIAIIMDGNGRWAKKQGQDRLFGHSFGVDSVRETLRAAEKAGVKYLTIYAFSTENWSRPKEEVDGIMSLMVTAIANEVDNFMEHGVKVWGIGDIENLPIAAQNELKNAEEKTANNTEINLIIALNYSSRWEISRAMKILAQDVKSGKLNPEDITDEVISSVLETKNVPDPELLIRTSGEYRISNFLLWQIAYTEFYFTDILWPDFRGHDLYDAIKDYQSRERRFGKITEQL